ncbi:hypothetical protein SprV_0401439800 [Sparganum proliferum]
MLKVGCGTLVPQKLRWQDRLTDTDALERTGILSVYAMLRQLQLRWSGHLVRMDDERLPKRLFYGDVATGSCCQGGQIRRYKDTLESSMKRLQINPATWEDLARDRPTDRPTVKRDAAIYEATCIAAANTKREARESQLRLALTANAQSPPMSNSNRPPEPTLPSSSFFATPTAAVVASATHINTTRNPDTKTNTNTTTVDTSGEDLDCTCPHCDLTSISNIGLVGRLRIHRTETGEPVSGAPTYTRRTRLHCPHCPRTFTHRMGLYGRMRMHESGIERSPRTQHFAAHQHQTP